MSDHDDLDAPDLRPIADLLHARRPQLTALELDATKQRIRARAATPARRRTTKGTIMKSRLAILMMLVLGMLLSTTGAGLAISGFSGSAATVQYDTPTPAPVLPRTPTQAVPPAPTQQVLPEEDTGAVAGEEAAGPNDDNSLQPTRQVEAGTDSNGGSDQLPFTGFAAIPVLLGGIALLSTGLVLRRRTRGEQS
jgi:hypothetical protein